MYVVSGGMVPRRVTGDKKMTNTNDLRTRLLAAAFAVAVSAVFFATAIVPASPNGLVIA